MRWLWFVAGIFSLIGGFFALANPFVATLAAERLAGWAFLFSGIMIAISAFTNKSSAGAGSWVMSLIVGVFVSLLGLFLLSNPLQGVVSLTIMVGIFLMVAGIARIGWAFTSKGGMRWLLIFSGILSLILSVMIFTDLMGAATSLLGILLGIELISSGVSLMFIPANTNK